MDKGSLTGLHCIQSVGSSQTNFSTPNTCLKDWFGKHAALSGAILLQMGKIKRKAWKMSYQCMSLRFPGRLLLLEYSGSLRLFVTTPP